MERIISVTHVYTVMLDQHSKKLLHYPVRKEWQQEKQILLTSIHPFVYLFTQWEPCNGKSINKTQVGQNAKTAPNARD